MCKNLEKECNCIQIFTASYDNYFMNLIQIDNQSNLIIEVI